MQKREIIFVHLPNTSHFTHFQSFRQKKWNIHNVTNEYRCHFRSKTHQTTSLREKGRDLTQSYDKCPYTERKQS